MPIATELREVDAIRAAFDTLVAHGAPTGKDRIIVSVSELVALEQRIEMLRHDLIVATERLVPVDRPTQGPVAEAGDLVKPKRERGDNSGLVTNGE